MIDFNKPLRFKRVQDNDHVAYQPRLVGSYVNERRETRWVLVLRYWDNAPSFIVYNDRGEPISDEQADKATKSTGIFDPCLENGPPISTHTGEINGASVVVVFDGDLPVKAKLL